MLYSNNVIPLHVPITTVIRERSRSQTVVKNYGHQLRRHPESEMNQSPLVYIIFIVIGGMEVECTAGMAISLVVC